jgi:RNA polymerase sigma-70 factor (sigma-E family)
MDAIAEQQFHEYVLSRRGVLLHEAFLMVGDVHAAEDLVQTALAKVYVAWHRVVASDSPDAYVRRIMVNANLSRLRRRRVGEVLTGLPPESAERGTDHAERLDLVRALIALPKRQRTAVVLRYWADLPEAEVAQIMGCSIGNVRSQAFRGLEKLRAQPALRFLTPGRSTNHG